MINPPVSPETTPEQTMAGVAPDGVVIWRVDPVIVARFATSPVIDDPESEIKCPLIPVTVAPLRSVKIPDTD